VPGKGLLRVPSRPVAAYSRRPPYPVPGARAVPTYSQDPLHPDRLRCGQPVAGVGGKEFPAVEGMTAQRIREYFPEAAPDVKLHEAVCGWEETDGGPCANTRRAASPAGPAWRPAGETAGPATTATPAPCGRARPRGSPAARGVTQAVSQAQGGPVRKHLDPVVKGLPADLKEVSDRRDRPPLVEPQQALGAPPLRCIAGLTQEPLQSTSLPRPELEWSHNPPPAGEMCKAHSLCQQTLVLLLKQLR
jgi:hypothetical protein